MWGSTTVSKIHSNLPLFRNSSSTKICHRGSGWAWIFFKYKIPPWTRSSQARVVANNILDNRKLKYHVICLICHSHSHYQNLSLSLSQLGAIPLTLTLTLPRSPSPSLYSYDVAAVPVTRNPIETAKYPYLSELIQGWSRRWRYRVLKLICIFNFKLEGT